MARCGECLHFKGWELVDISVILVDSYSQIYRGYYAIPGLRNSLGQPTNAIFAVARLLFQLRRQFPSDYGGFVFDLGRSAHRLELLPQYKANRPPMPDDLSVQLPVIRKWIALSGWPIFESEGWEADDIIASFTSELSDSKIRIVTSDKDFAQLVGERVKMLVPEKKGGFEEWSAKQVVAKFAVPPEKIGDYLSLMGDSSDNIPGIEGIGPKTAAKILEKFSSVEEIGTNPERIENVKLREKIMAGFNKIILNKKLIRLGGPLPDKDWKNPALLKIGVPDWDALERIAKELEMPSILKEIGIEKEKASGMIERKAPAPEKFETPDLFEL